MPLTGWHVERTTCMSPRNHIIAYCIAEQSCPSLILTGVFTTWDRDETQCGANSFYFGDIHIRPCRAAELACVCPADIQECGHAVKIETTGNRDGIV